jgi:hypothetical protein
MRPNGTTKRVAGRLVIFVLGVLVAGCGRERTIYSPPNLGNPANPPAVKIIVPVEGQTFHAHADIRLLALATPNGTDLGPIDISKLYSDPNRWDLRPEQEHGYSVEFLAGTNGLGVQTGGMMTARVRSHPGQATPMIVGLVGYPAVELVWHDAAAGSYALTARVTNASGRVTVSAPVNITVKP